MSGISGFALVYPDSCKDTTLGGELLSQLMGGL